MQNAWTLVHVFYAWVTRVRNKWSKWTSNKIRKTFKGNVGRNKFLSSNCEILVRECKKKPTSLMVRFNINSKYYGVEQLSLYFSFQAPFLMFNLLFLILSREYEWSGRFAIYRRQIWKGFLMRFPNWNQRAFPMCQQFLEPRWISISPKLSQFDGPWRYSPYVVSLKLSWFLFKEHICSKLLCKPVFWGKQFKNVLETTMNQFWTVQASFFLFLITEGQPNKWDGSLDGSFRWNMCLQRIEW